MGPSLNSLPSKISYVLPAFRPYFTGPLFVHSNGRPVTQWDLTNMLDKLSAFLLFPKYVIKLYSLCIGGTTMLYLQGVDTEEIKRRGR